MAIFWIIWLPSYIWISQNFGTHLYFCVRSLSSKWSFKGFMDFQQLQWVGLICRCMVIWVRLLWIYECSETCFFLMSLLLTNSKGLLQIGWLAKPCSFSWVFVALMNRLKTVLVSIFCQYYRKSCLPGSVGTKKYFQLEIFYNEKV